MAALPVLPIASIDPDKNALLSPVGVGAPPSVSFSNVLDGLEAASRKVIKAENAATAFATDDSIPIHQVMSALGDARSSVELMLQVRTQIVQGYQELMRTQL